MTSPSEPVESREQPRQERRLRWEEIAHRHSRDASNEDIDTITAMLMAEADREAAERDASIRNLETLRDVHRRTIDDLISEAQTVGATIDELRAEVERFTVLLDEVPEDDEHAAQTNAAQWLWERNEARSDLAAALAEVSRLRRASGADSE